MAEEILKDLVPPSDGQYRLIPCECGGEVRYQLIRRACGLLEWVVVCPMCGRGTPGHKVQHDAQTCWNGCDEGCCHEL